MLTAKIRAENCHGNFRDCGLWVKVAITGNKIISIYMDKKMRDYAMAKKKTILPLQFIDCKLGWCSKNIC